MTYLVGQRWDRMPFRVRPYVSSYSRTSSTHSISNLYVLLYSTDRLTCVQWLICTLSTLEQPRRVDGEPPLLSIGEQRDEA